MLWKVFRSFGTLVDAYVALKKDRVGHKFASILFLNAKEKKSLEEKLCNVRTDGAKITATVAKFGRNKKMIQPNQRDNKLVVYDFNSAGRSYLPPCSHRANSNISFKDVTAGKKSQSTEIKFNIPTIRYFQN